MKEKIKAWLSGPRVYMEGVSLYEQYGFNKQLKTTFNRGNNENTMATLVYELGKIAELTEQEVKNMPRNAKTEVEVTVVELKPTATAPAHIDDLLMALAAEFNVSVDNLFVPGEEIASATEEQLKAIETLAPAYAQVPETMKKIIRFREAYPFLKDTECPNELKVLVHEMFSAYDRYRDSYAALSDKNAQDENLALAATVVESYLDNRSAWEELDYYKENGSIRGNHEVFELLKMREEIAAMTDMDLISKINKTKPNITKAKTALENAKTDDKKAECQTRLDKWTVYVDELQAEIGRRKKQ